MIVAQGGRKVRTVGVVLFPGFELLDVFGPVEMFGVANELPGSKDALNMLMIAEKAGDVASAQGPKVMVDVTFADAPPIDVLLVPGGKGTRAEVENPVMLDWLQKQAATVEWLTSVCTGSGLLAKAGVLDGYRATSNKFVFDWSTKQSDAVEWVYEARWVEDRNRMTSSGVTAGMDMSLALLAKLFGDETADLVAKYTEYSCSKDSSHDPFAAYFKKG